MKKKNKKVKEVKEETKCNCKSGGECICGDTCTCGDGCKCGNDCKCGGNCQCRNNKNHYLRNFLSI